MRLERPELRESRDHRLVASGRARLALGQALVRSLVTGEAAEVAYGVLHLGDHNLSGGAARFPGEAEYAAMLDEIAAPFQRADLTETLRAQANITAGAIKSYEGAQVEGRMKTGTRAAS